MEMVSEYFPKPISMTLGALQESDQIEKPQK